MYVNMYDFLPSLSYGLNASCRYVSNILLYDNIVVVIKTHDSESRGQEETGRMRRMSGLFTGSTALKLVNALNKLPLKLSLSYQGLSTFKLYRISNPTMEEIGTTNPK